MDRYAVFGNPINHSKSPFIHTLFARQTQQQMTYEKIEAPLDGFDEAIKAFFAKGGRGANVTVPFKEQAFRMVDQLSPRAKLAGAVNTLKLTDDGLILGDNTDGAGLVQDLLFHLDSLTDKTILLVGAGGASRGVIAPILEKKPKQLIITNRTYEKAEKLAQLFADHGSISAIEMNQLKQPFDLIINATSASLGGELPDLPNTIITNQTVTYDMMYGAQDTAFSAWAKQNGAAFTIDGLGMLVSQAAESFVIWRGIRPGTKQVIRELRRNLTGL